MAAGLGFKDFVTGEVLTAADVDGYLMQGIWVFADATARDAAVTSPQEGNACYLKDTNEVLTYSGSTWVAVGGGSPLTTKGDLFTFSTTDARLPVGADGTTLVADSAEATGLKWQAAAGGGANWSLLNSGGTALTGATTVTVSGISGKDKIMVLVAGASSASNSAEITLRLNTDTGNNYNQFGAQINVGATYAPGNFVELNAASRSNIKFTSAGGSGAGATTSAYVQLSGCNSSGVKVFTSASGTTSAGNGQQLTWSGGFYNSSSTISSVSVFSDNGNLDAGTVFVYTSA